MSVSRRKDKTHTGHNGVATDKLRALDKLQRGPAGLHGRIAPPSEDAVRSFIMAQTCPWCGAGPFKVLATHTRRAHGITGAELRTLAGLTRHASICAEDHSAAWSERRKGQRLPDIAYQRIKGKPRVFSEAGKASQREKAAKVTQSDRARAARISGDQQLHANAAKHAEIVRLFKAGVEQGAIADRVGVSKPTVLRTLKREGLRTVDGRRRRWTLQG